MMDIRYFALDDLDIEDSGYEAGPIEVEAETLQYDTDDEDILELDDQAILPPAPPEMTVAAVLPSTMPDAAAPPLPKKPVGKATGETKSAPRKAAKKKPAARKKAPARKAPPKTARKTAGKPAKKTAGEAKKKTVKKTAAKPAKTGKKSR